MLAVVFALGTAITYGTANYVGPILGRRAPIGGVLLISQLAALAVAAVVAAVYHPGANDGTGVLIGLGAGVFNAAALGFFYLAVQYGDVAVVAPVGSVGTIVPVAVGLVQGERPGILALCGVPLALGGAVLASRARAEAGAGARVEVRGEVRVEVQGSPARQPVADRQRLALTYALLSAAAGGLFLTLSAHAAGHGSSWAVLWSRVSLVACTALVVTVLRLPVAMPVAFRWRAAIPGLLLVGGTSLFAVASTKGLLAVVSVLASLSPIVTVALAVVILRERLSRVQWCGVGAALVGVVLLASG